MTAELFQDKVGETFKISASQKSMLDVLGLQAKDEWATIADEPWVTIQAAICLSYFYSFGSCLLYTSCLMRKY